MTIFFMVSDVKSKAKLEIQSSLTAPKLGVTMHVAM